MTTRIIIAVDFDDMDPEQAYAQLRILLAPVTDLEWESTDEWHDDDRIMSEDEISEIRIRQLESEQG